MVRAAIVGNGPLKQIPNLQWVSKQYKIDVWIGADRGALTIIENGLPLACAIGDFDSVTPEEQIIIQKSAQYYQVYPSEKDWTDLELAVDYARSMEPAFIYMLGLSGGRLDHTLANIQMIVKLSDEGTQMVLIDRYNQLSVVHSGSHIIHHNTDYPNISFIPQTKYVRGLTLEGFYYPLFETDISWGSSLCVSNKLVGNNGTFSFDSGILIIVKSRDALD